MTRPFRAWIAFAVAVLAGLAAALLLHHPYVEGWRLLDGVLVVLAVAAALAAMAGLASQDGLAARIATPVLFGMILLWLWEMLTVGFGVPRILLPSPSAIALQAKAISGSSARISCRPSCARSSPASPSAAAPGS